MTSADSGASYHGRVSALDVFVEETRAWFAAEADAELRWTGLTPVLGRLLADPGVRAAAKEWPYCGRVDGRATNLLFYEDPDFGFAINGLTKTGAARDGVTTVHDHAHIYTLYGVLEGHERVERYERVDDRSRAEYAELERTADVLVGPGEIDLVRPYEIHTEVTVGERTVAIIVRSQKGGDFLQGRYDLRTHQAIQVLGPRQVPCEMIPA